jgi:hypothetical protein
LKGYFVRIKWWLLFKRGVNTRRDIQLEKIVSEYDAKGGGREREQCTCITSYCVYSIVYHAILLFGRQKYI